MSRLPALAVVVIVSVSSLASAGPAAGPASAGPASGPASADDPTAPRSAEALAQSDCARARARHQPCVLTLEPIEVGGGVASADGTSISPRTFATFTSLVRVRADFRAALIRAAEDL